jgi:8-oxo-dGTP pyrophosphatase MutT (NUDIX family)
MKKHSCGAILYTIHNNSVYVVLGMEKSQWFPFKGVREHGESNTQAAIREICEETCAVLTPDDLTELVLDCHYSTKKKHYHIGLAYISPDGIDRFYYNRNKLVRESHRNNTGNFNKWSFLEKTNISMIHINDLYNYKFHAITNIPIKHYYSQLSNIQQAIYQTRPAQVSRLIGGSNISQKDGTDRSDQNSVIETNYRPLRYLLS